MSHLIISRQPNYEKSVTYSLENMVICLTSSSYRHCCSGRPGQPLPSEPACPAHPQPNADEPHALGLRHHGRASVLPLRACSARCHGPPRRDGSYWLYGARDGSGCRRWHQRRDERRDPIFHVHAPAPDEHAIPGWGAVRWNHQPFPFVRGCEKPCPPHPLFFPFFKFLSLWLLKS